MRVCARVCLRARVRACVCAWVVGVMQHLLYSFLWYSLLVVAIFAFRLLSLNVDATYTWICTCMVLRIAFMLEVRAIRNGSLLVLTLGHIF